MILPTPRLHCAPGGFSPEALIRRTESRHSQWRDPHWEWRDSVRHWDQPGKAQAKLTNDDLGFLICEVTVSHSLKNQKS